VIELGLRNADGTSGAPRKWRPAERFAVVISRGFAEPGGFSRACRHLVAPAACCGDEGRVPATRTARRSRRIAMREVRR
jgi:hypothetical protein